MSKKLALRSRALLLVASGIAIASLIGCSALAAAATPTTSLPSASTAPHAAGTGAPPTASDPGTSAPGAPGSGVITSPPGGPDSHGPLDDGATLVKPDPKIVDLHPQGWDHVAVSPNGKTLTVYFWSGVQSCYGLGKVNVSTVNGVLSIRLFTGVQPDMVGKPCVEMAQLYKTIVHLPQPLIRGGTA